MNTPSTLLLADDNVELRAATREILEANGHRVLEAADGEEALSILAAQPEVELLVSDVFMPRLDGLGLVQEALVRRPDLPITLYSSRGSDPRLTRRLALGDLAFLPKPFSAEDLQRALAESHVLATERPSAQPVVPPEQPGTRPAKRRLWSQLAALFLLLAGLGWWLTLSSPPPMPELVEGTVRRGATVEPLFPIGKLLLMPEELRWRPINGATHYRVELLDVGGEALWESITEDTEVPLPESLRQGLHEGVVYLWSVEALGAEGRPLALSLKQRFQVEIKGYSPLESQLDKVGHSTQGRKQPTADDGE